MSAKRRQETIAKFSVPIQDKIGATKPPAAQGRAKRQRKRTRTSVPDDEVVVLDDDGDGDFVVGDDHEDEDFIDEDDDDTPARKKGNRAKGKQRETAKSSYDEIAFDGPNPKVMLISLKAGALGLNLTVANNVYL